MNRLFLYALYLFRPLVNKLNALIGLIVPQERGLWVFGSWYGQRYEDNPRYLFEYVSRNHPETRAVWLTGSTKVRSDVRALGFQAFMKDSIEGYLLTLKAEACIISHIPSAIWCDVNFFGLSRRCRVIQLYHGIHMKKYENNPSSGSFKARLFNMLFPDFRDYDIAIATSENGAFLSWQFFHSYVGKKKHIL